MRVVAITALCIGAALAAGGTEEVERVLFPDDF